MGKKFFSVSEMLNGLDLDKQFAEDVNDKIHKSELIKLLFALRCKFNINQEQLAEKMGCSQSKISKIETGEDSELNMGDLIAYVHAIGLSVQITLVPAKYTLVERIKCHAFELKNLLEKLASIANKDEKIVDGVSHFFGEAFYNFVKIIAESANKIKSSKTSDPSPRLRICANIDEHFVDLKEGEQKKELAIVE